MFSIQSVRPSAWCRGLGAILPLGICSAATARDIDPSVPRGTPEYTAAAPVPNYFINAVDPTLAAGAIRPSEGGIAGGVNNLAQEVCIDVDVNAAPGTDFVAAILDRDPDDNLYIKIQTN